MNPATTLVGTTTSDGKVVSYHPAPQHYNPTKYHHSSTDAPPTSQNTTNTSTLQYQSNVMTQLSVAEVRALHARALAEAESKRTELRLVVASRYRELVGSSDEVVTMHEQAMKLGTVLETLPRLLEEWKDACEVRAHEQKATNRMLTAPCSAGGPGPSGPVRPVVDVSTRDLDWVRRRLAMLPARIHRALDRRPFPDTYSAAMSLVELFSIVSSCSNVNVGTAVGGNSNEDSSGVSYPLAVALSCDSFGVTLDSTRITKLDVDAETKDEEGTEGDKQLEQMQHLQIQMGLIYGHVQTLPLRTIRLAKRALRRPAGTSPRVTAGALAALALLDPSFRTRNSPESPLSSIRLPPARDLQAHLLDVYYESKSTLLHKRLDDLEALMNPAEDLKWDPEHATRFLNRGDTRHGHGFRPLETDSDIHDMGTKLQDIVTIIQHDVILHSSLLFRQILPRALSPVLGGTAGNKAAELEFDPEAIRLKCGRFLSSHLPLLRDRMRSALSHVNTAAHLGVMRQRLYDLCTVPDDEPPALTGSGSTSTSVPYQPVTIAERWRQAVEDVVDVHCLVLTSSTSSTDRTPGGASDEHEFSLWSTLFSQTFDSLVSNLLNSSFVSLHATVLSSLTQSLHMAPHNRRNVRPHEAHRNCILIVRRLDESFRNLSEDAWRLVHHEERDVSSKALRQSLFVQTCETMGRLLCELRRLSRRKVSDADTDDEEEFGVRGPIVGRLCYFLQHRLDSLNTLLDPESAPSYGGTRSSAGLNSIDLSELRSAFDITDDDDDGLLSLEEAGDAMESAFSGFGGRVASSSNLEEDANFGSPGGGLSPKSNLKSVLTSFATPPENISFDELSLLSARGLRHGVPSAGYAATTPAAGDISNNALRTIQKCLNDIMEYCFANWSTIALRRDTQMLTQGFELLAGGWSVKDVEWQRLHCYATAATTGVAGMDGFVDPQVAERWSQIPSMVSPFIMGYILSVSSELNRAVCPTDSLPSSRETGTAAVATTQETPSYTNHPALTTTTTASSANTFTGVIRSSLLREVLTTLATHYQQTTSMDGTGNGNATTDILRCCESALCQMLLDITFVMNCFACVDDGGGGGGLTCDQFPLNDLKKVQRRVRNYIPPTTLLRLDPILVSKSRAGLESCGLYLTPLFGSSPSPPPPSASEHEHDTSLEDSGGEVALNPLVPNTKRFVLLPIQAEISLQDLQLRAQNAKGTKNSADDQKAKEDEASGAFGFFNAMKWKK